MTRHIRLGTRGSALARAQAHWVAGQLAADGWAVETHIIRTTGDQLTDLPLSRFGRKGIFVSEIENALIAGEIDVAVHSMKDLPGEMPAELMVAAVPRREDPRDVLIVRPGQSDRLATLRQGALIGTSSLRRRAQLLAARPDLGIVDLRGNVDTRLRKLDEGQFDAICLAAAGLKRLGLAARITEFLEIEVMAPSAGQGALAIQVRRQDAELAGALAPLHDEATSLATRAERTVLAALGGGCALPLGVLASAGDAGITISAVLCSRDGDIVIREHAQGIAEPELLGAEIAGRLRARGGHVLTEE